MTPQKAVQIARDALPEYLGVAPDDVRAVRVEEVVPPAGGSGWRVTLSYAERSSDPFDFKAFAGERLLRVITVDEHTEQATSMIMRERHGRR